MTNADRSGEEEALERCAQHSLVLLNTWQALREEWRPERPPAYVVMATFADDLVKAAMLPRSETGGILSEIEDLIRRGGAAADLAAVGFLEALVGSASDGKLDFADVLPLLGPRSLDYCRAWDKFTGCQTVIEAERKLADRK